MGPPRRHAAVHPCGLLSLANSPPASQPTASPLTGYSQAVHGPGRPCIAIAQGEERLPNQECRSFSCMVCSCPSVVLQLVSAGDLWGVQTALHKNVHCWDADSCSTSEQRNFSADLAAGPCGQLFDDQRVSRLRSVSSQALCTPALHCSSQGPCCHVMRQQAAGQASCGAHRQRYLPISRSLGSTACCPASWACNGSLSHNFPIHRLQVNRSPPSAFWQSFDDALASNWPPSCRISHSSLRCQRQCSCWAHVQPRSGSWRQTLF